MESWPVIIMWKIILNPPGQSPQTAGKVYRETKKKNQNLVLKNAVSGTVILKMNQSLESKEKTPQNKEN